MTLFTKSTNEYGGKKVEVQKKAEKIRYLRRDIFVDDRLSH